MADAITIKALKDASLDAKSLEEVVNGNDAKQVTTRLGETYPSVKKAIKTLFENGGLPATPFATLALMTASSLENDKYAMVTNDPITANNGLYVKAAGVWVKSTYDPVSLSKSYTDTGIIKARKINKDLTDVVSLGVTTAAYIENSGNEIPSQSYTLSDYIAVKKGDCFVLSDTLPSNHISNSFSLFDSSKNYVGCIGQGDTKVNKNSSNDAKLKLRVGVYSEEDCLTNITTIVPEDGFIKVGFIKGEDTQNILYKTSYEGLVNNSLTQLSKENMKPFDGLFHSVIMDKDIQLRGIKADSVVGAPVTYNGDYHNRVSKKYAISEGDYIHLMTANANLTTVSMVIEDASGNLLASLESYSVNTLSGANEGRCYTNYKSKITGFLRVQHDEATNVPCLIAITKNKVKTNDVYLKSNHKIDFYNAGVNRTTGINEDVLRMGLWMNYGADAIGDTFLNRSLPYLLKKGEVLEYEIQATIDPVFLLALPNGISGSSSMYLEEALLPVNATEILDLESKGIPFLSNTATNNVFVGDAAKGKVAYCNESEDTIVVFLRPNKASPHYQTYKCNNSFEINTLSKEEYIEKRNAELSTRFKKLSKYSTNAHNEIIRAKFLGAGETAYIGHASYPSVLLFKGEVLNCLTGSNVVVKGARLRNINRPAEVGKTTLARTNESIYHTAGNSAFSYLPIQSSDQNSYRYAQVYAQETCLVYVGFSALNQDGNALLDTENLIGNGFFKPRIVHISESDVGENIKPTLVRAQSLLLTKPIDTINPSYLQIFQDRSTDTYLTFSKKDSYLEYSRWVGSSNNRAVYAPLNGGGVVANNGLPASTLFKYLRDNEASGVDGYTAGVRDTQATIADKLPEDSLVVISSRTRLRASGVSYALVGYDAAETNNVKPEILITDGLVATAHKKILLNSFNFYVKNIEEDEFNYKYKVTDETYLHIPDSNGIHFNFCEVVSSSVDIPYNSVLQIKRDDKILAVLNVETANQGQSSVTSARKNINIEFFNSKGKSVLVKFDDNIPQDEYVLKSYLTTDKGMFKDNLSADLWSAMRWVEPYPIGGVFPADVFADTRFPENQVAKGTTFGFPTEVHMGDGFFSLASLRCKKKRDNYAMQSKNTNHILIQPDGAYNGVLSWNSATLGHFEVRNPKMSGYTEGDATLPVAFAEVQGNINRILSWLQGVFDGSINLRDTYKDYIDLDSFLDYIISINVMSHWDSVVNNFLLGTHDGKIWRVYFYDADQSWGSVGNSVPQSPTAITLTANSVFRTIYNGFVAETKRRYRKLRDVGVLNVRKQQADIYAYGTKLKIPSRKLDELIWGEILPGGTIPYVMSWTNSRTKNLDIYYDYKDESIDLLVQSIVDIGDVAAGETKTVTYTGTSAIVGDLLKSEIGSLPKGIEVNTAVTVDGVILVSIFNNTLNPVTMVKDYINITKEVKYG